ATASVAIASTSPVAEAVGGPVDHRALEAYSAWLHYERRLLSMQLLPGIDGREAEAYVPMSNAGSDFHFKDDLQRLPPPSTRAAAVLDQVGVEWRKDEIRKPYFPAFSEQLPADAYAIANVDGRLIELGGKFEGLLSEFLDVDIKWRKAMEAQNDADISAAS